MSRLTHKFVPANAYREVLVSKASRTGIQQPDGHKKALLVKICIATEVVVPGSDRAWNCGEPPVRGVAATSLDLILDCGRLASGEVQDARLAAEHPFGLS